MNILLQLRCCDPNQGSEFAISWGWLTEIHKRLSPNDHIYVATCSLTNDMLEKTGLKNVHILDIRQTSFLTRNILRKSQALCYAVWQRWAYQAACELEVKFDIIQLYSLSDFRHPGLWYKFKDAYTILGPVGGGQDCPKSLEEYDDKKQLLLRRLVNKACILNPAWRSAIHGYKKIYTSNEETARYMLDAQILLDVVLNKSFENLKIIRESNGEKVIILFCGRLIRRKGVYLLLDIAERIPLEIVDFEIHVYGDGPEKKEMERQILNKGLSKRVILKGKLPYCKMNEAYQSADIFLFPSLRESGGTVLIEAMANALPIVSLNMSVCKQLSKFNTGIFIDPQLSKNDIINGFVDALIKLVLSREIRLSLGKNGYQYVNNELTWDAVMDKVYKSNFEKIKMNESRTNREQS